jgi:signal transduction histidine kinase
MLADYKKKFTSVSLSSEYFIFSLVILVTIFMLSAFLYCYSYSVYVNDKNQKLKSVAENLQEEIETVFEENRILLKSIGLKIAKQSGVKNLNTIVNLLATAKNLSPNNSAISHISWSNANGKIFADNTGVLKNHFLAICQKALSDLSEKPWTLQVLQSTKHNDQPILQVAMGIENKNGEHLGCLIINLEIKAIVERLKKMSKSNSVNFTLMDDKYNLMFSSSENFIDQANFDKKKSPKNFIEEDEVISRLQALKEFSSKQKSLGSISYLENLYYKKIKSFSHVILISFDESQLEQEIHQEVFPKLYGFIFTGLFCIIVLYFFKKRIIMPLSNLSRCAILISKGNTNVKIPKQNLVEMFNLAKSLILVKYYIKKTEVYKKKLELANDTIKKSSDAMEDFVKSINKELMVHLKDILICTEMLLQEKKHIFFDSESTIKFIERIRESAINIKHKTSDSLNLTYFDFNHIINQAVQINLKHSSLKNIEINISLPETSVETYGDALKLKQILVGLIFQSIENSTENQKIIVSGTLSINKSNSYMQITIKDHGFGLSEDELQRVKNNIGWDNENYLFTDINIQFVKKLVMIHQGEFHVENKLHEGRKVSLIFPFLTEKDFAFSKEKNNVYYLHPENEECSISCIPSET